MSEIVTTFTGIDPDTNTLTGLVRVPSGSTATPTGLTFYFLDGSYLTGLIGDLTNVIYFAFAGLPTQPDAVVLWLSQMQTNFGIGGSNYGDYFNANGDTVPFTINDWADGLYRYEASDSAGDDKQWLIHIPVIEGKMASMARQLLDSQCNCKLDVDLQEKFVKAKAYQELIYSKVIGLDTNQGTIAEIQAVLSEVNGMIQTLTNFLNGTETMCGC